MKRYKEIVIMNNNVLDIETINEVVNPELKQQREKFEKLKINYQMKEFAKLDDAKKLFGNFIYEGELIMFFGDTGSGKSNAMYQIINGIAKGEHSFGEYLDFEIEKKANGLYFDFELAPKQIKRRYQNTEFADNFTLVLSNEFYQNYDTLTYEAMEYYIKGANAEVVVIDNISALLQFSSQDQTEALRIMKLLHRVKIALNVTIIAITHTPKIEEGTKITLNSMAGSKQLSNLADSVFAIGKSMKGESIRYLKLLKTRNTELNNDVYDLEFSGGENYSLQFDFTGISEEKDHLETIKTPKGLDNISKIIGEKNNEGISFTDLLKEYTELEGIKEKTAQSRIYRAEKKNIIYKDIMNGLYYLSN